MRHLIIPLAELSELAEKFLYNQGVTATTADVKECVEAIASHYLTSQNKLTITPVQTILTSYFPLDSEETVTLSEQLRSEFFYTLRDFDIGRCKRLNIFDHALHFEGEFDYHDSWLL